MIQHQTSAKPALSSLVMSPQYFGEQRRDADNFRAASLKRKQSDSDTESEKAADKQPHLLMDNPEGAYAKSALFYTNYEPGCAQTASYPWMKEARLANPYSASITSPKINAYSANLSSGSVCSSSPNDSINTPTTTVKTSNFLLMPQFKSD